MDSRSWIHLQDSSFSSELLHKNINLPNQDVNGEFGFWKQDPKTKNWLITETTYLRESQKNFLFLLHLAPSSHWKALQTVRLYFYSILLQVKNCTLPAVTCKARSTCHGISNFVLKRGRLEDKKTASHILNMTWWNICRLQSKSLWGAGNHGKVRVEANQT